MRIAVTVLDTSKGDDCPSGWTKVTTPVALLVAMLDVILLTSLLLVICIIKYVEWQWVIRGVATTDGFAIIANFHCTPPIDQSMVHMHVDGVIWCVHNLWYSYYNRKHVWTYASGHSDMGNYLP